MAFGRFLNWGLVSRTAKFIDSIAYIQRIALGERNILASRSKSEFRAVVKLMWNR